MVKEVCVVDMVKEEYVVNMVKEVYVVDMVKEVYVIIIGCSIAISLSLIVTLFKLVHSRPATIAFR